MNLPMRRGEQSIHVSLVKANGNGNETRTR
nr:MAG TPA: hypothetical protein [Caudoviricetes sp.]